ncbi:MAG: DMT family transporter [Bacteroidetes bacterium]|nr:DMT family transporter [Bacteroidota bacterium]
MPFIGEIAAVVTAFLWAGTSIAFTEASIRVGSLVVNITRMVFAAIYLTITILLFNLDTGLSWNQIYYLSLSGLIGLVFGDGFLFRAFKEIGARLSMLLMAMVPAISTFLAFVFLGEVISLFAVIGIATTTIGVAIVVLQRKEKGTRSIHKAGLTYGILGAVGQAVGLIFAKYAFNESEVNGFVATLIRIVPSIIVLYPVTFFIKSAKRPFKILFNNRKGLIYTAIGSVIGPFLGITGSLIAISYTYVGIASTLMATVPIIMLPLVKFYYKEELSNMSIVGAFMAVAGVAILFLT